MTSGSYDHFMTLNGGMHPCLEPEMLGAFSELEMTPVFSLRKILEYCPM